MTGVTDVGVGVAVAEGDAVAIDVTGWGSRKETATLEGSRRVSGRAVFCRWPSRGMVVRALYDRSRHGPQDCIRMVAGSG